MNDSKLRKNWKKSFPGRGFQLGTGLEELLPRLNEKAARGKVTLICYAGKIQDNISEGKGTLGYLFPGKVSGRKSLKCAVTPASIN